MTSFRVTKSCEADTCLDLVYRLCLRPPCWRRPLPASWSACQCALPVYPPGWLQRGPSAHSLTVQCHCHCHEGCSKGNMSSEPSSEAIWLRFVSDVAQTKRHWWQTLWWVLSCMCASLKGKDDKACQILFSCTTTESYFNFNHVSVEFVMSLPAETC